MPLLLPRIFLRGACAGATRRSGRAARATLTIQIGHVVLLADAWRTGAGSPAEVAADVVAGDQLVEAEPA
jgi:hypothetical protein